MNLTAVFGTIIFYGVWAVGWAIITFRQHSLYRVDLRYEAQTGVCSFCRGDPQAVFNTERIPVRCRRCRGTGIAPHLLPRG